MRQSRGRGSKVETEARPCEAEARPSQLKTASRPPRAEADASRTPSLAKTPCCAEEYHYTLASLKLKCSVTDMCEQLPQGRCTNYRELLPTESVTLTTASSHCAGVSSPTPQRQVKWDIKLYYTIPSCQI